MKISRFSFSRGVRLACAPLLTMLLISLSIAQTVSSVILNPASVPAVVTTTGTVTLAAAAPTGG